MDITAKMNTKQVTSADVVNNTQDAKDKDKEDDYVTKSIGAFGFWQFIFIIIASLTRIVATSNVMSIVFIAPETKFVCRKFSNGTMSEVTNNTCYNNCLEYEYTNDIFENTIISDFGLICKKTWLQSLAQTLSMTGVLCGVALFGWFSDRYGRSKALMLSGITSAIFMFATPFCPNYWSVALTRFIAGIGTGGYYTLTPVYLSELVGTRKIDLVVCLFLLPFDGVGLPVLGVIAYFTSTWQTFMIICSAMTVFIVCLTFFLPETPRWLVSKGKGIEATELMTRAAKFNRYDTTKINENVTKITEQVIFKDIKDINLTYLDLFRTKRIAIWTFASISIWFVTGFSYFGLLQYISTFGSNFYINTVVLGGVQIIAAPLSVAVVKFCGRKVSSVCIYSLIGLLSLALVFIPKGTTIAVVFGSLGVTAASISFSVVYIIVIELYPTPMRNMGLSVSSIGSKVAAMIAPFVVNIHTQWIASAIFAAAGFLAVIFCFILPETKGKKLKDTVDDL